ncbi:MAG: hypothetical protein E7611_06470 [Ruminococcaceae bacterium]|nr:hypothetical protein [Oscillospiraceae bacterium]
MNKKTVKRKLRYGSVSLLLCVLVIASAVILNVIAAMLCMRYDWMYAELARPAIYEISDDCREYLEEYVIKEVDRANEGKSEKEKIKIILCDTEKNIRAEQLYGYILDSVYEISEMFPGYFEIEHLDIWERPTLAASYGVKSTEDVVCVFGDKHQTVNLKDMYIIESDGYTSTAVAYNGEKMLASCLMRVTQSEDPMCYLTLNHGEVWGDYEFIKMIAEAGYTVGFLDLYAEKIPEDCDLLVTFDPKKDMAVSDDTSAVSEIDKLEKYMASGGKYMVFVSADTFASGSFVNFESFLASKGVKYMHESVEGGIEACYLIRDSANSLTTDGCEVLAEIAGEGIGAQALSDMRSPNAFGNSTCITVSDGFKADGNGNYVSKDGKVTTAPLFVPHNTAIAWSNGRAVARASEQTLMLMTLSEQKCDNGETGYLIASASVDFASGDAMQSSVIGNSRTLTELVRYMGKENAPSTLVFKPFGERSIQSLTTRAASVWTVILIAIPALSCTAIGAVVLIRRRNR